MRQWLRKLLGSRTPDESGSAEGASDEQIDEWMREAYALHQSGRTTDAEDRYRRILRVRPGNVDALYLLGEIAHRTGRTARAIELIGQAIAAKGDVAAFHYELGFALRANREPLRAEESFARAIELAPDDLQYLSEMGSLQLELGKPAAAEKIFRELKRRSPGLLAASVNLGSALMAQNRLDEATESLNEALKQDPFCVQALSNLGAICVKQKNIPEAQRLLERALEFDPLCFEARVNLAVVFQKQWKWEKALRILEDVARIRPDSPELRYNLGRAYWHRGNYPAAEQALRDVTRLAPEIIDAAVDLGKVLYETGRAEEAVEQMRSVLQRNPERPLAHVSLGFALETMGEFDQAMACYEKALALDANDIQAHVNRGVLRILTGDFERGWPEYEWRVRTEELVASYGRFPFPRWDGSPLAGRTLLVHAEQGLGDEIMYGSCVPELIAQAGHCVIECADKLQPLFARSFPQATVRGMAKGDAAEWLKDVPAIDVQIPAASLPLHLRRKAADFPRDRPYLTADAGKIANWRARLGKLPGGLKIGLSWRGGVPLTGNVLRSIPLERMLPVLQQEGVSFVSLQYGEARGDLDRLARLHDISIEHWQEAIDSYEETAALMCALDLTITVCTAVVHLGGALGRPVWTMAPLKPEARYGVSGDTMPWYGSVRMFRQPAYADWDSVIARVSRELSALVAVPVLRSSPTPVSLAQ
jgi:tetratricopeptide (TPR) repeat protein